MLSEARPGLPYIQVAGALRAAILTKTLEPGDKIPSGSQLATRYGVARMTVQQAIRVLRDEGLVVSRQGSGVFVRERTARSVGLRPVVERAFQRPNVTIDFFGFTAETLLGAVREPLDKIRAGSAAPESIAIRILVPDSTKPAALPCRADDLADDPAFRERSHAMTQRHNEAITDAVHELDELGLIGNGTVEVRVHQLAPLFKAFILNREELFLGFYPVVRRQVQLHAEPHDIYDLMGKDATLFHHAIFAGSPSSAIAKSLGDGLAAAAAEDTEKGLCAAELAAVTSAVPTPHADALIDAWHRARGVVGVVSNNSDVAVAAYAERHGLALDFIVGRTESDPSLLKPDPYLVASALSGLGSKASEAVLIGDSPSDIVAGALPLRPALRHQLGPRVPVLDQRLVEPRLAVEGRMVGDDDLK